jgi:nitrite reductase/ring-hydroxylating ferredoxin subunit
VYEYTYGREGQILRCPWHEWEYDIATGESLFDPNVKVVTYPVEVVGDDIVVTIGT